MQDKLKDQQKRIDEQEKKMYLIDKDLKDFKERNMEMKRSIEKYESLPGFMILLALSATVEFITERITSLTNKNGFLFNILTQVFIYP